MTSPDQWSSGQPDSGWGDMREMADQFIREFFGKWLSGNYTPLDTFRDGQRDVEWRLDELEKVSGYCNLVMSKNWNVNGGGLNGFARAIPFDTPMGPEPKNASPFKGLFHGSGDERYGILIEKPGTWRLDAQVTTDGKGSLDAGIPAQIYLSAWNKDTRRLYSERRFDATLEYIKVSNTISHTIVVPEALAGKIVVCVSFAHGQGRWMVLGGDRWSGLSVNRWDLDASGPGNDTRDPVDGGNYD
ncbi:hypothetical protein GS938_20065 [Rhodococcus hoagii]|nr:hypothetical protein [Prescottella equi]NKW07663.1 hypothetical protein [Prescottella equi]NKW08030.1 hypothetical protein [Prescottella equi]